MKKLALVIGTVVILVGLVMGGLALHAGAAPLPNLTAWGSTAPGTVTIVGNNWTKAVAVNLYMDAPPRDLAHQVAVATPGNNGVFTATFTVGPTTVGPHTITAVQGGNSATATFTITNTSQVNTQILAIQQNIDKIGDKLGDVPVFDTTSGHFDFSKVELGVGQNSIFHGDGEGSTPPTKDFDYHHQIRHVSLTLDTENMTPANDPPGAPGDEVDVYVNVDRHGTPYPLLYKILPGPEFDSIYVSVDDQEHVVPGVVHSFEFDTDHWYIKTTTNENSNLGVYWSVTTFAKPEHHDGQPPA